MYNYLLIMTCLLFFSEKEWLGALPVSIPMLAAPAAMALNFKIGTWGVLLLGTVLTTLGLGLSGLAQNVGILFFTYGTVAALGITLLISPPAFLIDQIYPYNHPRHVLATSIAACGSPLGEFVSQHPIADPWGMNFLKLCIYYHNFFVRIIQFFTSVRFFQRTKYSD